ncbi:MAG: TlpA family protein disulfide reductase [Gammaproteobacteria bacterium]|nr:TlpA family protein disulfide reductase [Gammaproteobacteria bacterium]
MEMKILFGITTLVACVILVGCGFNTESTKFTITGERIFVSSGANVTDVDANDDSGSDQSSEELKAENQQEISVVITRNEGPTEEVTIASGTFTDDKIVLEGNVKQWPTPIDIFVSRGNEEPMRLHTALLDSETNPTFVLLDFESDDLEDRLLLSGVSRMLGDDSDKFKITGDLSSISDQNLTLALAEIEIHSENPKSVSLLSVTELLLDDGKFFIEGIAGEPFLVDIGVSTFDYTYFGLVSVVVEPGAQIEISPSATSSSFAPGNFASPLLANSQNKNSLHATVIESWQNSEEYLAKMEEYAHAIENAAPPNTTHSHTEEEDTETAGTDEQPFREPYDVYTELQKIEFTALTSIAQNLEDPMASLLAMEIGALAWMEYSRKLENWYTLASVLKEDVFSRRVVPQRDALEKQLNKATNAESIVEGQSAPDFTLANLEGDEVALYDILASNEVVLVNFWASWCVPCIDKLPKLNKLHAEYRDKGFEIVFVSIDDSYDDWKKGSEKHDVSGINVGDLHGFLADTPVAYGIQSIPTEFLLDSKGEILERDVTPDELKSLLVDHFGETNRQDEED